MFLIGYPAPDAIRPAQNRATALPACGAVRPAVQRSKQSSGKLRPVALVQARGPNPQPGRLQTTSLVPTSPAHSTPRRSALETYFPERQAQGGHLGDPDDRFISQEHIDLHWHDLRHEVACRLLAGGVDIRIIQLMLGHSDVKTTQRHLNIADEEMRKALTGVWEHRRQLKAGGE